MEDYQERVAQEEKDLSCRIQRLEAFINSDAFALVDIDERVRMQYQLEVMHLYDHILCDRINHFHD
jgi:hypothetical protein